MDVGAIKNNSRYTRTWGEEGIPIPNVLKRHLLVPQLPLHNGTALGRITGFRYYAIKFYIYLELKSREEQEADPQDGLFPMVLWPAGNLAQSLDP